MTKEQILQAEGDALSRMAGAFLGEKYDNYLRYCSEVESEDKELGYGKVDRPLSAKLRAYEMHVGRQIDPIALTPTNAFKWRDWAVEKYGDVTYKDTLVDVYCDAVQMSDKNVTSEEGFKHLDNFIKWLATEAHPKHYIKAAMLCKIEST